MKCDNHFHENDCARYFGLDEVYRSTDARIFRKVRVVLCAACENECPNGRRASGSDVYCVPWRLIEVIVRIALVSVADKGGPDLAGAYVTIPGSVVSSMRRSPQAMQLREKRM